MTTMKHIRSIHTVLTVTRKLFKYITIYFIALFIKSNVKFEYKLWLKVSISESADYNMAPTIYLLPITHHQIEMFKIFKMKKWYMKLILFHCASYPIKVAIKPW